MSWLLSLVISEWLNSLYVRLYREQGVHCVRLTHFLVTWCTTGYGEHWIIFVAGDQHIFR